MWRSHEGFDRDDVASEAEAAIWRSAAFRRMERPGGREIQAYVGRTVFHTYVRMYRREERRRRAERGYAGLLPDAAPESVLARIQVIGILSRLGREMPDCPKLLVQRMFHGEPYEELAKQWGKTVGALRMQVHRCLKGAYRLAS